MRLIGVIDLLARKAVHARGGCRHAYRPLERVNDTPIDGDAVALARLYTFIGVRDVYVADLDAIAGGAEEDGIVRQLATEVGALWLDAAVSTVDRARRALARGATRVVVGLETLPSFAVLRRIVDAVSPENVVFSLDLRGGRPMTAIDELRTLPPAAIATRATDAGVSSMIVLDVERVGSGLGVDVRLLAEVRRAVPGAFLIVGGGVRNPEDLQEIAAVGCDAALVATALQGPAAMALVRYAAEH